MSKRLWPNLPNLSQGSIAITKLKVSPWSVLLPCLGVYFAKQKPVLFYFLALYVLIQPRLHSLNQGYMTLIDIRPYGHRSDSTSLSTTIPVVPLCCEPANTLCWWEWGGLSLCEQACVCVCVWVQGKYKK